MDVVWYVVKINRQRIYLQYLWRIGDSGLNSNYPVEIIRMWNGLPKNLSRVDAVYERPDNKIVFFIGKLFFFYFTLQEVPLMKAMHKDPQNCKRYRLG